MDVEKALDETSRLDPWIRAHDRMCGRFDAANLEQRRALKDGRIEDAFRWGRIAHRRLLAQTRISKAMRALVRTR